MVVLIKSTHVGGGTSATVNSQSIKDNRNKRHADTTMCNDQSDRAKERGL